MAATDTGQIGESWKWESELTDRSGSDLLYSDLDSLTILLYDEIGVTLTYTKSSPELTVGDNTSSFHLEIPAADTSTLCPGFIKYKITGTYTSPDFSLEDPATSIKCGTFLIANSCP